jgi:hypothetical protein
MMTTHRYGVIGVSPTNCGIASSLCSLHASPTLWAAIGHASMIARLWMPSSLCSAPAASGMRCMKRASAPVVPPIVAFKNGPTLGSF